MRLVTDHRMSGEIATNSATQWNARTHRDYSPNGHEDGVCVIGRQLVPCGLKWIFVFGE